MGVLRFNYHSEVLGMYTDITVTYPTGRYTCGVTDGSESGLPGSGVKKRAYEAADSLYAAWRWGG